MLVNDCSRACPFCEDNHLLRLHGWYARWGLFPDPAPEVFLPIRRLYCPHVRRTVSLLPDFCVPRRQHGPAILGRFLHAVILRGVAILAALRTLRPHCQRHSVAQSLLKGFLRREEPLRAYTAQLAPRHPEVPRSVPESRRALAGLLLALCARFQDAAKAFVHHGRCFHERFKLALA
jgi:hypothetical protein